MLLFAAAVLFAVAYVWTLDGEGQGPRPRLGDTPTLLTPSTVTPAP